MTAYVFVTVVWFHHWVKGTATSLASFWNPELKFHWWSWIHILMLISTMSPFQHGEVLLLMIGNRLGWTLRTICSYQDAEQLHQMVRFTNQVIRKRRRGDYLGGTVQVIHISFQSSRKNQEAGVGYDVLMVWKLVELSAILNLCLFGSHSSIRRLKKRNSMFVHLTLVPYIKQQVKPKTKPTQHSVKELRSIGD